MSDRVRVTFYFEPEDPDPSDPTGISEDEYNDLMDRLIELGAEDVEVRAHG
jgi:hypothetical protein